MGVSLVCWIKVRSRRDEVERRGDCWSGLFLGWLVLNEFYEIENRLLCLLKYLKISMNFFYICIKLVELVVFL